MKSLLIQLDDPTYQALQRIAPPAQRKRSEFIRKAIRRAVMEAEDEKARLSYLKQPQADDFPADWTGFGEF